MEYKDYYKILGVAKDADEKAIKRAYRQLARQYHPDKNPENDAAEEKFKEINEAYQVLSDPQKKQMYDQFGHAAFDGSAGAGGGCRRARCLCGSARAGRRAWISSNRRVQDCSCVS